MNNNKKGSILCIAGSILSLLTIFLWSGKSYLVSYVASGQEMIEEHNVFELILNKSILEPSALFLVGGVIAAIIVLNRAISGILNNKNNTLLCSSLLSINVISAYILYLYRDQVASSMNINVAIGINVNVIIMQVMLIVGFLLSVIGTIVAYRNKKD